VYRTYIQPGRPATTQERSHVASAVAAARDRRPDIDPELLGFLGEVALGAHGGAAEVELGQRLQQLTAPVMAKGVEDTAFYRYHRLVSLNEVGGNPGVFGRSVGDFHRDTAATAATWPHSMLTLSTHDTKRSADVRARLNVLSEVPDRWRVAVERWAERNEPHRRGALDRNTEYLLYQTLVGAWPIEADRVVAFMAKAVKEAKVHTSWTDPDAEYDEAVASFARAVLDDGSFVEDFEQFLAEGRIVERGRRSSLAQTTLLLTCPGVPDLYQGSELWDLSLVDPDNRRPVDYHLRARLLEVGGGAPTAPALAADDVGLSKQWLIRRLLAHRRSDPGAYESDTYEPLELRGARADDAVGFTRAGLAVVVARHGLGPWAGTSVGLPPGSWSNVLTGESTGGGDRRLDELLGASPVAVLARSAA
jgi:(1->4)-alpha-D-glucan 1-alpha-D-glucosylmutase